MLRVCDIVLYSDNSMLSKAIKLFSRQTKEDGLTEYNHVSLVDYSNYVIEALPIGVKISQFSDSTKGKECTVYRLKNLSHDSEKKILDAARSKVGKKYGYLKILGHFLDYCISRPTNKNIYFFRKFCKMENYPICSWLVGYAFSKANINFGLHYTVLQPDDIGDFIESNRHLFTKVIEKI